MLGAREPNRRAGRLYSAHVRSVFSPDLNRQIEQLLLSLRELGIEHTEHLAHIARNFAGRLQVKNRRRCRRRG